MTNIKQNKLSDPLEETTLPTFSKWSVNHHSCTQLAMATDQWVYKYIMLTQEERRLLDGNANMAAGVAVNDAIQYMYANTIYRNNPATKKLFPFDNIKLSADEATAKVLEKYNQYNPVNDKDREKFEHYKDCIPQTIFQATLVGKKLDLSKSTNLISEQNLSYSDDRLLLSIIGRSDLEFQSFGFGNSHLSSAKTSFLLEFKTSWDRPAKTKKDGSRSFTNAKIAAVPMKSHVKQIAFYQKCKPESLVKLIYLVKDDHKIFDKDNCGDLEAANLNNYYEELVQIALRRERLLTRYQDLDDVNKIKENILKDVEPNFDTPFGWNIGVNWLNHAKQLWKQ